MNNRCRLFLLLWLLSADTSAAPMDITQQSQAIAKELRCPAALNQSVYESEAPIAAELKAQIYQQLEQGATAEQIMNFMVQRYGERIRYRPALTKATALLWGTPPLLLLAAIAWLLRRNLRLRERG